MESGNGTRRKTEEFVIHPNLIKTLRVGLGETLMAMVADSRWRF